MTNSRYLVQAMDITSAGRLVTAAITDAYVATGLVDAKEKAGSLQVRHSDRVDCWAVVDRNRTPRTAVEFEVDGAIVWNT